MPMSRRFYRNLADKLKSAKPVSADFELPEPYEAAASTWAAMVLGVMSAIEEEAPSFDKVRFAEAAGIPLSASV